MVATLDSLSLKNTKLGLETLDLMGVNPNAVKLVLNRADSRVGMSPEDVPAITGRVPDALIPSHRDIPRSVNEARPVVRTQSRSDAAKALRTLASSYVGVDNGRRGRKPWRRG
jgi:pilus assembly protein CpaE